MKNNLKSIVLTAVFAALVCVATMSIRIPTPGTGGYIHPGDALVILSGIFLGPIYGLLAGGIGSALADLLGGYFIYVPITFVIKGLVALVSAFIFSLSKPSKVTSKEQTLAMPSKRKQGILVAICGIADIIIVAGGYYLCEIFLYGPAASLANVPANIIQGTGGLVLSLLLYPILSAIPDLRELRRMTNPSRQ